MVLNITEGHGELNFIVMWTSVDRRPCVKHYSFLKDARKHYQHLDEVGREPSLVVKIDGGTV